MKARAIIETATHYTVPKAQEIADLSKFVSNNIL